MTPLPGPVAWAVLALDRRRSAVLVVALALALVGGWALVGPGAGAGEGPPARSEAVGFHPEGPSSVDALDTGTLRHGLDGVYLRSHTGRLAAEFRYRLDSGPRTERVRLETSLVVEARRGGSVVWRYETPLRNRTVTNVSPGAAATVAIDRPVSSLRGTLDRLEESTGVAPTGTHLAGRAVRLDATGARRTISTRMRVEVTDRTLGVHPDAGQTHRVRPGPADASPWWAPVALAGGVVGVGAVAGLRLLTRFTAVDRARLREPARRWRYRRHLLPVATALPADTGHPVPPGRLLRVARRRRRPVRVDPGGRLSLTLDGDRYVADIAAEG